MLPEANGQNRHPEDMSDIEGADCDRTPRGLARETVVIAERDALRPEMVGAVNDEHGNARSGGVGRRPASLVL